MSTLDFWLFWFGLRSLFIKRSVCRWTDGCMDRMEWIYRDLWWQISSPFNLLNSWGDFLDLLNIIHKHFPLFLQYRTHLDKDGEMLYLIQGEALRKGMCIMYSIIALNCYFRTWVWSAILFKIIVSPWYDTWHAFP